MEEQQTHLPLEGTSVPRPEHARSPVPVDDEPIQYRLPFDLDEPIPFALTARARRAVRPDSLPELTLLNTDQLPDVTTQPHPPSLEPTGEQSRFVDLVPSDLDDPNDTRPSRARALRHAGVPADQIAEELDVDELVVRAWVDDVAPVRSARRRLRAVAGAHTGTAQAQERVEARRRHAQQAFDAARSAAAYAARDRITDPAFVSGLGLITGVASFDPSAVVIATRDEDVARACLRWLVDTADLDTSRVRVVLRLAPQVSADRAVDRWRRATDVPADRIGHTRWRQAPDAEAVEALIRVVDPRCAGRLAGWRDALLGSFGGGDDRPF